MDDQPVAHEIIFHNQAILKLLGGKDDEDEMQLFNKPLFSHKHLEQNLSLFTAFSKRYSEFTFSHSFKIEDVHGTTDKPKLVMFQRSEIFFNNRNCIMLNLRDVSNQKELFDVSEKF